MTSASVIDVGRPATARRQSLWRYWRGGLRGSEFAWAAAFLVPYAFVFFAFVVYPVFFGLWMGSNPALFVELFDDPIDQKTLLNTFVFLVFGVNLKLFFALLLSGFFMRKGWWVKGLLMFFVLPWAVPALPSFISIHWMLNGEWGFINNVLYHVFDTNGPSWLNERWMALGSAIYAHLWKWLPFWTVILLAGRMSISQEIYDAAEVDGATGLKRFTYITFPLLANMYLVLTLLATIFLLGDFNSVFFVTGGGPANSTHLLATLGIRNAYEMGNPELGVAAVMSALPVMIPLVIILMRRMKATQVNV
jgi:multiple sugar transport system permease protein